MTDSPAWKTVGQWALSGLLGVAGGGVVQYARVSDVKSIIDERIAQENRVQDIEQASVKNDTVALNAKLDQLIQTTAQIQASQIRSEVMDEVRDKRIDSLERKP